MSRIIIARHGNTFEPGQQVLRVGARTDLPLASAGLEQAKNIGRYLQEQGIELSAVFTSTLQRTIQTATMALEATQLNLAITQLPIFDEIDYGPDENQPEDKVIARVGWEALKAWEAEAKVPEGWNVHPLEIIKNWQVFANRLKQDYAGKTILVITSNGIARFVPYLTGDFIAFATQYGIKISTGALCVFENNSPSEVWKCLQWNVKPAIL